MEQFIGREKELAALERLYEKDGFQMLVMYGRRRVGKSTLLQHFADGKRCVYYMAIRSGAQRNLELLGACVLEALAPELAGARFASYEELFAFLGRRCAEERVVFVIDELPYLVEQEPSLLSVLQKTIDLSWSSGRMMLVLCGSSVSFMENEVLGEKSPLFGRRSMQMRVQPFSYREAAAFVPSYSREEQALCYGVTGGIAKYLALLDDRRPLADNLVELFFDPSGYLYEEPANLLTQEFRNIATYSAVIEAVASGRTKLSEIADLTHLDASTVAHAARNLIATGIVKKTYAITEERNKKKVRYALADHMFRFWYRFLPKGMAAVEAGHGAAYFEYAVRPLLSDYMGAVFEDMCRAFTLELGLAGAFPGLFTRVGAWWGTHPAAHEETDIDVVALDEMQHTALLGECKYKNERIDRNVLDRLRMRDGLIDHRYHTAGWLLFSKSGFTEGVLAQAESEQVRAVTLADLYAAP